jgi:hypothetical protein
MKHASWLAVVALGLVRINAASADSPEVIL